MQVFGLSPYYLASGTPIRIRAVFITEYGQSDPFLATTTVKFSDGPDAPSLSATGSTLSWKTGREEVYEL
jgi:hypothetical protein